MNLSVFRSLALGSHSQAGNIWLRDAYCDTFGCCWRWWFFPHKMTMKQWWHLFVANWFATFGCCLHFWLLFTLLADCLEHEHSERWHLMICLWQTCHDTFYSFKLKLSFDFCFRWWFLPHRMTMSQWWHLSAANRPCTEE